MVECPLHSDLVEKVNKMASRIRGLMYLTGFVGALIAAAAILVWSARSEAKDAQHNLDVHTAGQGQRIKNIEDSLVRIEKKLE